ncbi:MAG: hypothetical protein K0R70_2590, partial [Steroidobacteraceae bacterium]|nr:hypothetical protein [Steroidobacteraceae bacterium]
MTTPRARTHEGRKYCIVAKPPFES